MQRQRLTNEKADQMLKSYIKSFSVIMVHVNIFTTVSHRGYVGKKASLKSRYLDRK